MNMFVIIIVVVLSILVLLLLVGLFLKKGYIVNREIFVNRPKSYVFDFIRLLKNQDDFSVWAKIDPNMKKEFRGNDGTAGFVSDAPVHEHGENDRQGS